MDKSIPSDFRKINNAMYVYYVAHGLALWLGCAWAASFLVRSEALPIWARLPCVGALIVLSGLGLFFLGLQGHEGFHGNLNSDRRVSMLLGIAASSVMPFFISTGYTVIHWQHHRFTNTERDPDFAHYSRLTSFWSRLARGAPVVVCNAAHEALVLIFRRREPRALHYPFPAREARVFASLNVVLSLAALAAYAWVAVQSMHVFLFYVVLPWLVASSYFSMLPYIEHAGTGVGYGVNARTCTSWLFSTVLLGYCYHQEHHLYPNVQLHKLGRLHRYRVKHGLLSESATVEPSTAEVIRVGVAGRLDAARVPRVKAAAQAG